MRLLGLRLALLLPVLAACGDDPTTATDDPSSTASGSPSDTPTDPSGSPTAQPTWACEELVSADIDYAREPDGFPTPEEAALAYAQAPQGAEAVAGDDGAILLVPAGSDEIAASATVVKGSKGWWVDSWTECAK